jgi:hypothetical protein
MAINWKELARQVGDLNPDDSERGVERSRADKHWRSFIGEENLRNAVEHFILQLFRMKLWQCRVSGLRLE